MLLEAMLVRLVLVLVAVVRLLAHTETPSAASRANLTRDANGGKLGDARHCALRLGDPACLGDQPLCLARFVRCRGRLGCGEERGDAELRELGVAEPPARL